ncbi:hypothetical protein D1647_00570 [Alistipes sp. Z76]|nr:hypothetical protein [Alistipes sp. Z76]NCE66849.1 hypothetical protein [Muribaculaceae bacterium M3]
MRNARLHNMLLHTTLLVIATLVGCRGYDAPTDDGGTPQAPNISIADLHDLCGKGPLNIDEPLVAGGYVTSSDRAGNFNRTFTIEDPTGGMEIMAGLYDLHNIYPSGCYVTVRLEGCAVAESHGVLQAGISAEEYDRYPTSYFSSRALLDRHVRRYDIRREVAPAPLSTSELDTRLCGKLVTIGPLRPTTTEHADGWNVNADGTWSGYNFFADDRGTTVAVYTSAYADYADRCVPDRRVALTGILQYGTADGEDCFMIKMRDENDCIPYD